MNTRRPALLVIASLALVMLPCFIELGSADTQFDETGIKAEQGNAEAQYHAQAPPRPP